MKLDSPLFNRIRVKPYQDVAHERVLVTCEYPGCGRPGTHRAPKGRGREGEYWRYCLDHVRAYNHSYNYFAGMPDDAVAAFQKDAVTGHRPTWRMGMGQRDRMRDPQRFTRFGWRDSFRILDELGGFAQPTPEPREGRIIRNAERRAFHVLGLELDATAAEIKARFKQLVKRHHPDAHGGDRSYEAKLRDVIQAYNYLKSTGFC